jgi:hypothetical protein
MATTPIDDFEVLYASNSFVPRIWLLAGGQVNLYYHQEDYANALDLLRNDSPTYLLFSGTGAGQRERHPDVEGSRWIRGEGPELSRTRSALGRGGGVEGASAPPPECSGLVARW